MALSDFQVFSEYAYGTMVEVLAENLALFNDATGGGLVLRNEAVQGDYKDATFWGLVTGLVRRRNVYGSGAVTEKVLNDKLLTEVKVAAGTPPIRLDPSWFAWMKRSPAEAAAVMGQQLAEQTLADMVHVAVGSVTGAILNIGASVLNDITAGSGAAALPSPLALANTGIKLGDRQNQITCWIMHSKSWNDLYGNALANNERLFQYGNVNVISDPLGRRYVVSDQAGLILAGSPNNYYTLGLTQGGVTVSQSDDFFDNWSTTNGDENIKRTYQAEWSYTLGVKGCSWDKTNGGHNPNDAALFTGTNWDQVVTSIKDGPGVVLKSK